MDHSPIERQMIINQLEKKPIRYQVDSPSPLPDEGVVELCFQMPDATARRLQVYLDDHLNASADSVVVAALNNFLRESQS